MSPAEIAELQAFLTAEERAELDQLLAADVAEVPWRCLPGPQTMADESEADIIGFGGSAGGGKGLALDTPIATPTGWTTMGALVVGDEVFAVDGTVTRVTAVSEITNRPCYQLTFDDGAQLVADDVHRWVTFDAKELAQLTRSSEEWKAARRAKRPSRAKETTSPARLAALKVRNAKHSASGPAPVGTVRDTATLASTLKTSSGRLNHAVVMPQSLQLPDVVLPLPPYTLGAWLGDGSSRNGQLTGKDPGVWERIEAEGFEVVHYTFCDIAHNILKLKKLLSDSNLLQNKHIPSIYLRASHEQRLALLQGLMDTDGHAALDGGCEFDGINETLCEDVCELALSLGLKATLLKGTAKLNGRAISDKWRVRFTTSVPVFGLQRKLDRLRTKLRRVSSFRYLVQCAPVDSVPTVCIAVAHPSRTYLAGRSFVPTHNTDLVCGQILTKHKRCLVARREKAQTEGVIQRLTEILGETTGYNSQRGAWRIPIRTGVLCEFAGLDDPSDHRRWQGRPHDLKAFDEVTEMRESQVRFVMGWTRTNDPTVKAKVIMTFNPPTTTEGRWVIGFFGPWLDKKHPLYPTQPGVLRYAAMLPDGRGNSSDKWVPRPDKFVLVDGEPCYEFDPDDYKPEDIIEPKSRTFIPARLTDNPYYMATGYMSTLQSLPEPLRSQMLYGDFNAGTEDDAMQVIPTAWVEAAQARWKARAPKGEMLTMGVDVARGGKDNTAIVARYRHEVDNHDFWFDYPKVYPGPETPDGDSIAGLVVSTRRDEAPVSIDVIGVGASPYDCLNRMGVQVLGINVAEKATRTDKSGRLKFPNLRSQFWWSLREALDPREDTGICLPPDTPEFKLLKELTAPRWKLHGMLIVVESRDEIIKRLGYSPDVGTAYILALQDVPKRRALETIKGRHEVMEYDPFEYMSQEHNPYS